MEKQAMEVQEEDQEIALIEQSYDAGIKTLNQKNCTALSCSRSFAAPSVCYVGSAGCR